MGPFLFLTAIGAAIAVLATPLVIRAAWAWDLVDRPDGHRKLHGRSVPLGGGVSLLVAFVAAVLMAAAVFPQIRTGVLSDLQFFVPLCTAMLMICLLGLIDDRFELRGRQKLFGQTAIVSLLVYSGIEIRNLELLGFHLELGLLSFPFTVIWLLGAINALNLIDGVDGLAATVGLVMSASIAIMAAILNRWTDAIYATALAGSLLGFLVFNLPPAKIFLGDAGSMLIGISLGILAIRASIKGPATVALAAPTAVWAVLFFDVLMAVLRRKLTGQSLYTTDRGHMHHSLMKRGFSGQGTVAVIALAVAACSMGALVAVHQKSEIMTVISVLVVFATLIATRLFGHSECKLLFQRVSHFASSMLRVPHRDDPQSFEPVRSRVHGHREWDILWEGLIEFAERLDVSKVQMNVNSPTIHEEYHAIWERPGTKNVHQVWRVEIPLVIGKLMVGKLKLEGASANGSTLAWMADLLDGLRPFEVQLKEMLEHQSAVEMPVSEIPAMV